MPLAMQERPLELTLSQPTLGSHERQEVLLAQLPGTSIELGSSRRDQRRRSSALSAASSVSRRYQPLDDGMEAALAIAALGGGMPPPPMSFAAVAS